MTSHPFHKLQGAGNDFVLLDTLASPLPDAFDWPRAAQALCARNRGVGADGLLALAPSQHADFSMRMWNPDGTEDMCGNGLRCLAAFIWRQKYTRKSSFFVQTLSGIRQVQVVTDEIFTISMGKPDFAPQNIPILENNPRNYRLEIADEILEATSLSTGSTHTVLWREQLPDDAEFRFFSPQIEVCDAFPERTSVMWTQRTDKNRFKIRIWERGAGETLACGTGACAVGVAAKLRFPEIADEVFIESAGGVLSVKWKGPDEEIFLTGPAKYIFRGVWS